MKKFVGFVVALMAALALVPSSASAYLHAANAADTCWSHVYPSAEANLRPYGGIRTWGYNFIRSNDTSMQLQINAFSNTGTFVSNGDGLTYYLTDRLACRVVGNDPGTVTAIADWGTTWRNAYTLWN